ncbi:MAG: DNA adenine methylase [Veillonella caviae]|nr:DNA adenine methylase [Veillonella caviae]
MVRRRKNEILAPIVKWVGGKRQLLSEIVPLLPKITKKITYVEPFIGGGAVIFDQQPVKGIINDYNAELINVYEVIKNEPKPLLELLEIHKSLNSADYFYEIRELDRDDKYDDLSSVEKAARIIYLNKTCYNGLFRVNQAGQFNTPYGKYKNPNIVNRPVIMAMSDYFNSNDIQIMQGDYRDVLRNLDKNSFVYLDPPYMPISSSSSFTGYTENGFSGIEQLNLKNICDELNERGIKFLLSNSDHPYLREIYSKYKITTVQARRTINSNAKRRGEINEILVRNYGEDNY